MHTLSRGGGRLSLTNTGHHLLPAVPAPNSEMHLACLQVTTLLTQYQILVQCQDMQLGDCPSENKWVGVDQLSIERGHGTDARTKAEVAMLLSLGLWLTSD